MDDSEIPEDILTQAEKTLDLVLCNCSEAGDVRQDSIEDIARALMAERERTLEICRERAGLGPNNKEWQDACRSISKAIRNEAG